MTEDVAVGVVGIGIVTILVLLRKQVEEGQHVFFMLERSVAAHTEKLREVECHIFIDKLVQEASEVVSVDVHLGQAGIGVGVAEMYFVPFLLGALLHDIVPRVDFFLLIIVEQIEGRSRKAQHLCGGLGEFGHHSPTQFRFRPLVGFI